jgi:predicted deacylase
MKPIYIALVVIVLLALIGGAYLVNQNRDDALPDVDPSATMPVEPDGGIGDGADPLPAPGDLSDVDSVDTYASETTIGTSVDGREITAYHFGNGGQEILLVAGMHGSYSPNTTQLADALRRELADNQNLVPDNTRVTVVPVLNPDGLANNDNVAGRFNANNVDLNRNFGCNWAATSRWQNRDVSGGTAAFSEPEAAALRNYVNEVNLIGAMVWYAAEGQVYASSCGGEPSTDSVALANAYAAAADYPAAREFDAYQINGDLTNWLADNGVPTISVLLSDRQNTEFSQNLAGVQAAINYLVE